MQRTPGQVITWVAAAVLATLAVMRLVGGGGEIVHPQQPPVRVAAAGGDGRGERASAHVHVAGAVRRPGLYELATGARVAAALERAGGPRARANLAAVNLAARVEDGQQIVVPVRGAGGAAVAGAPGATAGGAGPGAATGGAATGGAKLSLASATTAQLEELDGIGPTLAKRIVEYRESKGGFRSIGQLREVDGIGEKRFEALRDAVGP